MTARRRVPRVFLVLAYQARLRLLYTPDVTDRAEERLEAPYTPEPSSEPIDDLGAEHVAERLDLGSALKHADDAGYWPGW